MMICIICAILRNSSETLQYEVYTWIANVSHSRRYAVLYYFCLNDNWRVAGNVCYDRLEKVSYSNMFYLYEIMAFCRVFEQFHKCFLRFINPSWTSIPRAVENPFFYTFSYFGWFRFYIMGFFFNACMDIIMSLLK